MRRQIFCRFLDGSSFLKHLHLARRGPARLTFLGDFGVPLGEVLRVTVVIDELGERHDLHLRLVHREVRSSGDDATTRWLYTAEATDADAVWLEMLARKCAMAHRLCAPRSRRVTSGSCGSARPFAA